MKIVWVDFNARTMSGLISLSTSNARRSVKRVDGIMLEELIILTDGTIAVIASVVELNDVLFGKPHWETMKKLM